MAQYHYDEAGSMAAYFVLTFLSLILIPLTISFSPSRTKQAEVVKCECSACVENRERLRKQNRRSLFNPQVGIKAGITIAGWVVFALLAYKVATTRLESTVYDPFEILGIRSGSTEKEIKRHFKRISLKFHPDKVKLAANQTLEEVSAHFVELTKAYKSLTDETVRKNLELYGHPDGKQEYSVGIALPKWIVESRNNGWVLGVYAILFGGVLPALVGRWWFGSRTRTKDGVQAKTAEKFFKAVKEESSWEDLVQCLARASETEGMPIGDKPVAQSALQDIEARIDSAIGNKWRQSVEGKSRRALTLVYAHLLRLEVTNPTLKDEQSTVILQTPTLLASLLSITLAHSWLLPTLSIMHLHAYLAQALLPGSQPLLQLPTVERSDVSDVEGGVSELVQRLKAKDDSRLPTIQKASERWGKLEIIDPQFKVIGERLITPGAIVQLVFKARLTPPVSSSKQTNGAEVDVEEEKKVAKANEERDNAFLLSKNEADELKEDETGSGFAHAPHWPADRRPQWWVMIGDQKLNRVIVPPMRFSDVPYDDPHKSRNYRIYKMQFPAPPNVGLYTFQIHFVSDTFIGEDVQCDVMLKVEDLSALTAEEQNEEDEISDPEEDSLAGQMAAMRGGAVKKSRQAEESDDESTTDGEGGDDSDSSSDSD